MSSASSGRWTVGVVVALLVGAALGYFLRPMPSEAVASESGTDALRPPKAASDDKAAAASIRALRARVADLERQLLAGQAAAKTSVATTNGASPARRGWSIEEGRRQMERLAREDPARYAQITNRMARMHQHRAERVNAKLDYLADIDKSGMTAAQLQTHEAYQELIARREELEERRRSPDMTDAQWKETFREQRQIDHELRRCAAQERETLISLVAKSMGFTGEEASNLSGVIGDIVEATDQSRGFPPPPPPSGGAPDAPMPPPPGP